MEFFISCRSRRTSPFGLAKSTRSAMSELWAAADHPDPQGCKQRKTRAVSLRNGCASSGTGFDVGRPGSPAMELIALKKLFHFKKCFDKNGRFYYLGFAKTGKIQKIIIAGKQIIRSCFFGALKQHIVIWITTEGNCFLRLYQDR
jgi:hypothetical protein